MVGKKATISFTANVSHQGLGSPRIYVFSAYPNPLDGEDVFTGSSTFPLLANLATSATATKYSVTFDVTSDYLLGMRIYIGIRNPGSATANSVIFSLGEVQLESGSANTQFEFRPYAQELALCQRYFYKTYNQETAPGSINASSTHRTRSYGFANSGGTYAAYTLQFPVTMRTSPSCVVYNSITGATNSWRAIDTSSNVSASMSTAIETAVVTESSNVAHSNTYIFHITASAEF
jgi:hypothetical protein